MKKKPCGACEREHKEKRRGATHDVGYDPVHVLLCGPPGDEEADGEAAGLAAFRLNANFALGAVAVRAPSKPDSIDFIFYKPRQGVLNQSLEGTLTRSRLR